MQFEADQHGADGVIEVEIKVEFMRYITGECEEWIIRVCELHYATL
jgi:uncharacterized protein YbjQ (UPF0145 family)